MLTYPSVHDHVPPAVIPFDLSDFDDFSNYIPRYSKPAQPCDYCWSKQLECFIFEGTDFCTACNSLFRQCSLTDARPISTLPKHIDTLYPVQEDSCHQSGALTSSRQLISLGATAQEMRQHKAQTAGRFPRATVRVLQRWLEDHNDHPYPDGDEKGQLRQLTGLTDNQVSTWLANARRRAKAKSQSTSLGSPSQPVKILSCLPKDDMTPMERWKVSPPEHEPALVTDIARAIAKTDTGTGHSTRSQSRSDLYRSTSDSIFTGYRAPSTVSFETLSSKSAGSGSINSHASRTSYSSFARKDRRRKRNVRSTTPSIRPFKCTFCTDSFQTKYDWTRHERSLHLKIERWICAPLGPVVAAIAGLATECVYCYALDPSQEHIDSHNHQSCCEKGTEARTFYRKDHLRQHLRLVHEVAMTERMATWKATSSLIRSRCGFCLGEVLFTDWDVRAEHLARHFRSGTTMDQWHGGWGFDADIEKMVQDAIPPYLIGQGLADEVLDIAQGSAGLSSLQNPTHDHCAVLSYPNSIDPEIDAIITDRRISPGVAAKLQYHDTSQYQSMPTSFVHDDSHGSPSAAGQGVPLALAISELGTGGLVENTWDWDGAWRFGGDIQ